MLKTVTLGGAVAAVALATAFTSPAQAQTPTPLYGGGSTLASIVYRDLTNCFGSDSGGSLDYSLNGSTVRTTGIGCLNSSTNTVPVNPSAELLYAPVGSGAGQNAYIHNSPTMFGTPSSTNPPYTSSDFPAYPYPHVTFAGSDVPLNPTQVSTAAALGFGQAIQVPSLITGVTVPFNPGSGGSALDIRRVAPVVAGVTGSSGLMLTRENLCGIFNGDINDWSDTRLAADNNNHQLTTTPTEIKVIYRHDGSGTTGLFAAAIISQCAGTSHPQDPAWAAASSAGAPYTAYFINAHNHVPNLLPSNFHDEEDYDGPGGTPGTETGNAGVIDAIVNKPFTIGYSSPDFTAPFGVAPHLYADGTAPVAANIQNQASVTAGTKKFIPPGPATAKLIMNSAAAPASADPNTWATDGQNPDPGGTNTYPIGGFTWLYVYQCYANNNVVLDLSKANGFLTWLYGPSPDVPAILANHGFSPLPTTWKTAIKGFYTQGTLGGGAAKIRKAPSAGVCVSGAA